MQKSFSNHAIQQLRGAIGEADGNEVFFLGRTDEARLVVEVEPLARGNRDAVPAIMIATSFGDVVIHNHPSGHLTPSQADLEIASLLGNQGDAQSANLAEAIGQLSEAAQSIRTLTDYLSRHPEALLRGKRAE